jgi:hypothetical protein
VIKFTRKRRNDHPNESMTDVNTPRIERWLRSIRWYSGVALLALAPKCLLCAAGYLGLGAALGLTGPELCGATPRTAPAWMPAALAAGAVAAAVVVRWRRRRRRRETVARAAFKTGWCEVG